jgi:hypothetical protein
MPMYNFLCPKCGWCGDRIAKMDERDEQKCGQIYGKPVEDDPVAPDNATEWKECDGVLTREEISLNAKMAHMWQVN